MQQDILSLTVRMDAVEQQLDALKDTTERYVRQREYQAGLTAIQGQLAQLLAEITIVHTELDQRVVSRRLMDNRLHHEITQSQFWLLFTLISLEGSIIIASISAYFFHWIH